MVDKLSILAAHSENADVRDLCLQIANYFKIIFSGKDEKQGKEHSPRDIKTVEKSVILFVGRGPGKSDQGTAKPNSMSLILFRKKVGTIA